jgi:signal transduction histidine kinase
MKQMVPPRHAPGPTPEDTAHLDRKMQKTRVALTGCYFLIGCAAYGTGAVAGPAAKVLCAIAVMPLSAAAALVWMKRAGRNTGRMTAACLGLDTLLASWVIYWTGGGSSPCLPFYLTPVMAAAFRFGPGGTWLFTLLAVAGYSMVGFCAAPCGLPVDNTPARVLRITVLFAAPAVGIGALHRKLVRFRKERALRLQVENANRELETACRERKAAQDQLLHAEKLSSLGRLVAGVAHEINNPLSFVYGNLAHLEAYVERMKSLLRFDETLTLALPEKERREALKSSIEYDFLCEDMDRALTDSRNGTERVRKIVDALRKFSRLRKGTVQQVDVREVLENAVCILAGKRKGATRLIREYRADAQVRGDPDELNQLFLNLLSNAVDALEPAGGTIRLRTLAPDGDSGPVTVEVEDDGPGIPPENRDRIFEPFFTTKEVGRGTGLGLSIAYGIARRHRGEIALSIPPGGGSLFRVSLPRWRDG